MHANPGRYLLHAITGAVCRGVFISLIFLLFNCSYANAQRFFRDYDEAPTDGIGLNLAFDAPVGNLQYTYKPAINYNLSYYRFFDHATATVGIGYRTYKPKQDVFYYAVGDNDYGTISYSDFRSYIAYLGAAYNIDITDGVKAFGGFNLGCYITKFRFHSADAFVNSDEQIDGEQEAYFAPKLGASIDIGDNLQLNFEGAYSIFAPTGKREWNHRVGTIYSSFNIGSGIVFKF
ncbi:hypothetical protein AAFN85_10920 [Mucilaginibacter sp. CAU 1740]|uniref:hypothetical protein n=1 Tax=Mucilaginibacter sp. CAU 1740 TaxID=3140365 RepID=UPI00325ABB63